MRHQLDIEQSPLAQGKKELLKHLKRQRLTQRQAILAKCFECMAGYADGKRSCKMQDCSLWPFMPYKAID